MVRMASTYAPSIAPMPRGYLDDEPKGSVNVENSWKDIPVGLTYNGAWSALKNCGAIMLLVQYAIKIKAWT
jgi:hypothetical protein